MQEVQKNIYFVSGEDKAQFPYCNGLYLRAKETIMDEIESGILFAT